MRSLAESISSAAETWNDHHEGKYLDFDIAGFEQVPTLQLPKRVRKAKENLIDSAFKIIELAAGPSGMISIAISQTQLIWALKWLLHFKIFDRIPQDFAVPYDDLADEANVPVSELTQMLQMAMTNHIFCDVNGKVVRHSQFSWKLARDGDFLRGLPFFCDTVMPAIGIMVDKTTMWHRLWHDVGSDVTARDVALDVDWDFDQFLTVKGKTDGYTRLMSLLNGGRSLPATYSTEVVHGSVDWSSLPKGALVVDLNSRSPCVWELAELFPHLRFHVHVPLEDIEAMKDHVKKKGSDLLNRIEFRPWDEEIARKADVYLFPTLIYRRTDRSLMGILESLFLSIMAFNSKIIFIESLLPDSGYSTLAKERMSQCRNVTIWQMQNCSNRTLRDLKMLVQKICSSFYIESQTRRPNSTMTTVVFRLHDGEVMPQFW
ncbi:hypothetical protein GGI35DRAFT_445158 [Trichoderma velutinum]